MTTFKDLYDSYEQEDKLEGVPAGSYTLEVSSAKNVPNKNYIQPSFKIVAGPLAGRKVLAGVLSYTENARSIFFQRLEGFGLGKDFFALGPAADDIAKALVGRVVNVELDVQTEGQYAGRNQLPIKGITLVSAPGAPSIGGAPVAAPPAAAAPAPAPAAAPVVAPVAAAPAPVAAPVAAAPAPSPVAAIDADPGF